MYMSPFFFSSHPAKTHARKTHILWRTAAGNARPTD